VCDAIESRNADAATTMNGLGPDRSLATPDSCQVLNTLDTRRIRRTILVYFGQWLCLEAYAMTQPEKGQEATRIPAGEQAAEENRSSQPEAEPSGPTGKASTTRPDQIEGCAADTIHEGDGNYQEPPD
jgi:hypothetical protein